MNFVLNALLAVLVAACSSGKSVPVASEPAPADSLLGTDTSATITSMGTIPEIVLAEQPVPLDSARALLGESIVAVVGSVQSDGVVASAVALSIDDVSANFASYVSDFAVPPLRPGQTVDVVLMEDSAGFVPLAKLDRVLVFISYTPTLGWYVVGNGRGVYTVDGDGTLIGAKGSPLDRHAGDEVLKEVRSVGADMVARLDADRTEQLSTAKLLAFTVAEAQMLEPLDVQARPIEIELGANVAVVAASKAESLWCRDDPVKASAAKLADICVPLGARVEAQTVDGTFTAIVPVPLRPPTMNGPDDTCEMGGCYILLFNPDSGSVAFVRPSQRRYEGLNGEPAAPVVLPTHSVPLVEDLDVEVTDIGRTADSARVVFVTLTSRSTTAAYASWCSGDIDSVEACNVPSAQLLVPISSAESTTLLTVPATCAEGCRVIVVDAADFGRRATRAL